MKTNLLPIILGTLLAANTAGASELTACSSCEIIPTDLLNRPMQEALKLTKIKLRMKKELYLINADRDYPNDITVDIGSSGGITDCVIMAASKYMGKKVACSNSDGSPREIELSKKGVNIHGASPGFADPYTLDIKLDLPLTYNSTGNSLGIRSRSTINCHYSPSSTLGDLVNALSDYYEVDGTPETDAPTI
jgi:hypothetical protein